MVPPVYVDTQTPQATVDMIYAQAQRKPLRPKSISAQGKGLPNQLRPALLPSKA